MELGWSPRNGLSAIDIPSDSNHFTRKTKNILNHNQFFNLILKPETLHYPLKS